MLDHSVLDGCPGNGGRPGEGVRRALGPCSGSNIRRFWAESWRLGAPEGPSLTVSPPARPLSLAVSCPSPYGDSPP